MPPDDIIQLFRDRWVGTAEELASALEFFYQDIRSSIVLALGDEATAKTALATYMVNTLDDYVGNHYGEDNIPA